MKRILRVFGTVFFGVSLFVILVISTSNAEMRDTAPLKLRSTPGHAFEMPNESLKCTNNGIIELDNRGEYVKTPLILSQKGKLAKLKSISRGTAIVGGTIIDGTGSAPIKDGVILIEGNKIVAVGKKGQIMLPRDIREIDATGKYIIPGLMDGNVHLYLDYSIEFMSLYEGRFEELIEEAAQVALKSGLTTVFDTWGPLQPLMNVRDRINSGETVGSRMFVAGNIVGLSGPFGRDFNPEAGKFVRGMMSAATKAFVERINAIWIENVGPDLQIMTPEQVRTEIRKYISRGIDFLKYASNGHGPTNAFIHFSAEVQKAIVEESHKAGLSVQAHTTTNEGLRMAIEAGVDFITHCGRTSGMPIADSTLSTLIEKQIPCGIMPRTKKRYEIEMKEKEARSSWLKIETLNRIRLIKAGIPLVLASDAALFDPNYVNYVAETNPEYWEEYPFVLGEAHFLWCKATAEMGLSPMDIILAATRNVAAAYHKLDQLGTLEKWKLADLVILDADPLADINNIRKIFMVMKDGQVVERDRLPIKKIRYCIK
jgi:imidazolonepropionase-like amidohydrolase